jgi:hypothetical protein
MEWDSGLRKNLGKKGRKIWLSENTKYLITTSLNFFDTYCEYVESKRGITVIDKGYFRGLRYRMKHNDYYITLHTDDICALLGIIDAMCKALLENELPFSPEEMKVLKLSEKFVSKFKVATLEKTL